MNISQPLLETIGNFLQYAMGEEEAKRSLDLDDGIGRLKKGEMHWQLPFSLGVHIAVLHFSAQADSDKAACQGIVMAAAEPLEATLKTLNSADTWERRRMLLHVRFALGFLFLAKGDGARAEAAFAEMASTRSAWRASTGEIFDGPRYVQKSDDVSFAAWFAHAFMQPVYEKSRNYQGAVNLATCALCLGTPPETVQVRSLLDRWCQECETEDSSWESDIPSLGWLDVFASVGELLASAGEADISGSLPNECRATSQQFWAWEMGQVVGRVCAHERWRNGDPFDGFLQFLEGVKVDGKVALIPPWQDASSYSPQRGQDVRDSLILALGLFAELGRGRDPQIERDRYVHMWENVDTSQDMPLSQIGPHSDLYWSMRIGFADKIVGAQLKQIAVTLPDTRLDRIETIVSRTGLQLLKHDLSTADLLSYISDVSEQLNRVTSALPKTTDQVRQSVEKRIGRVCVDLPTDVIDALCEGEQCFGLGSRRFDAVLRFHKAVELYLRHYLVDRLVEDMQAGLVRDMIVSLSPKGQTWHIRLALGRDRQTTFPELSLGDWGRLFAMIADPKRGSQANSSTSAFVRRNWLDSPIEDLGLIAPPLIKIQNARNKLEHPPYRIEPRQVEEMRDLVLGVPSISIITRMSQFFAPAPKG